VNWNAFSRRTDEVFNKLKPSSSPFNPGIHKFDRVIHNEKCRIHLRIDSDGNGTLLVNAAQIYHLNPSATLMAFLSLSNQSELSAISRLSQVFQIPSDRAKEDYSCFLPVLESLLHPEETCPVCDLDLDTNLPFSSRPSAPYRIDLALTYRCNNNCSHCYNARPRNFPELTTSEWKQVIKRCWERGIPHIIFTGGEPTLRNDLPELIAFAESQGQITGINTNGRRLSNSDYINSLVDAGLDHIQITLESSDASIHDRLVCHPGAWQETIEGIRNAVTSKLYVMTNTTLLKDNFGTLVETLNLLEELHIRTVGLNALIYSGRGETVGTGLSEEILPELLFEAQRITEVNRQKLIWYTPTQYCHFDPMALKLGIKGCTAALYNMCIEPDGAVLPCQSYYQPVGNMLTDSWDSIWNNKLSISLRERRNIPTGCTGCSLLLECGGGCPLHQLESQPIPILKEIAY
jgi:radical SAM protein with 4Fe4S-binding SPASM domain